MSGEKRKAVLNAGPIIHLSEVNCFKAIGIFLTIVPKAVYTMRLSGMESLAQKS